MFLLGGVVVVVVLGGLVVAYFWSSSKTNVAKVVAEWTGPTQISQAPAQGHYAVTVSEQIGGAKKALPQHAVTISVMPTAGVRIMGLEDADGSQSFAGGKTQTSATTDADGRASVTVEVDFVGPASLTCVAGGGADAVIPFTTVH